MNITLTGTVEQAEVLKISQMLTVEKYTGTVLVKIRELKHIEPSAVITLYILLIGFIQKDKSKANRVKFELDSNIGSGGEYLRNIGFLSRIEAPSLLEAIKKSKEAREYYEAKETRDYPNLDADIGNVSNFSGFVVFKNHESIEAFRKNFEHRVEQFNSLNFTNFGKIKSGLRDILIPELSENSITHGSESEKLAVANIAVSYSDKVARSLILSFGDIGKGLAQTLVDIVPSKFAPDKIYETDFEISELERAALYAFEINSTRSINARAKRIRKAIETDEFKPEMIPTGLYFVRNFLAKEGGTVEIISEGVCIEIAFSTNNYRVRRLYDSDLVQYFRGTCITIRLPDKYEITNTEVRSIVIDSNKFANSEVINLQKLWEISRSLDGFILEIEREFVNKFRVKGDKVFLISFFGLKLDSKTIFYIFHFISFFPWEGHKLVFVGMPQSQIDVIDSIPFKSDDYRLAYVLDRISTPSIIIDEYFSELIKYPVHSEIQNREDILAASESALFCNIFAESVSQEPGQYFKIRDRYFTQGFFHTKVILDERFLRDYYLKHLLSILHSNKIDLIVLITNQLAKVIDSPQIKSINVDVQHCFSKHEFEKRASGHSLRGQNILIVTDVICRGETLNDLLSPEYIQTDYSIFSIVDGREKPVPYFPVNRESSVVEFQLYKIFDHPIKSFFQPNTTSDHIARVVPETGDPVFPARYDGAELAISISSLSDYAVSQKLIDSGHIEFRGEHYNYLLDIPGIVSSKRISLIEWFSGIKTAFEIQGDQTRLNTIFLESQRGYEDNIQQILFDIGVYPLGFTKKQIRSGRGMPNFSNGESFWFVIPAISSGDTTHRCLELASKFEAKKVIVSILFAKQGLSKIEFYQSIKGFLDCPDVSIRIFSAFPSPSFSESTCPLCRFQSLVSRLLSESEDYPRLRSVLRETQQLARLVNYDEATDIELHSFSGEMIKIRSLIASQFDKDDPKLNSDFYDYFDSDKGQHLFRVIGIESDEDVFNVDFVRTLLADKFLILRSCANHMLCNNETKYDIFALIGIHQICQDILDNRFPQALVESFTENEDNFHSLITLAMIFPREYGVFVFNFASKAISSQKGGYLLSELVRYPYWFGSLNALDIRDLEDLISTLARSQGWGDLLDKASVGSLTESMNLVAVFVRNAIDEVINRIERLEDSRKRAENRLFAKPHKPMWLDLLGQEKSDEPEGFLSQLHSLRSKLLASTNEHEIRALLQMSSVLGVKLVEFLKGLYISPYDLKAALLKKFSSACAERNISLVVVCDDNVTSLLISQRAIFIVFEEIIANAIRAAESTPGEYSIEILFEGRPEQDYSHGTIRVINNIPFESNSVIPAGGLRQAQIEIRRFGAYFDLLSSTSKELFIYFRRLDQSKRYVYA